MAIMPIIKMDNPVLHQKAKRVRKIDDSIQKLIDNMIETMHDIEGIGLAAPQVGVPLQVVVIQVPDEDDVITLINPEVVKISEETETMMEGCLSLPGYNADVKRSTSITVKARDRQGTPIRVKGEGLLAQVLQHETDHINGIVFVDHLKSMDELRKNEEDKEETGGI